MNPTTRELRISGLNRSISRSGEVVCPCVLQYYVHRCGLLLQTKERGLSVGLSVTIVSPAKTAESVDMLFGMWTRVGTRSHVLDGVQIPHAKGQF